LASVQRSVSGTTSAGGWYALSGERLYCIATRAGLFPDTGWHQPGEMGGVWAPPLKLLDGYWMAIRQADGSPRWLTTPVDWRMAADGVTFRYELPDLHLDLTRRDWIAPGESVLVIDLSVRHLGAPVALGFALRSDLHGAWLSDERLGLRDGQDTAVYRDDVRAVVMADEQHPEWNLCAGSHVAPSAVELGPEVVLPEQTAGLGASALLWYDLATLESGRLRFIIAGPGSDGSPSAGVFARYSAPHATERAHAHAVTAVQSVFTQAVLDSPDAQVDAAFAWAKVANRAMMLTVPGLGRAPVAGYADFPWWFGCDISYGVLPFLPTGQGADAVDSLLTLKALSAREQSSGRVLHEVITNGVVIAPGNLVETPLFARTLYHTYRWTGDRRLLDQVYPFSVRGMLEWALGERLMNGEVVPWGESIVETPDAHSGVQTLDVGTYMVEALHLLATLAAERGDGSLSRDLLHRSRVMRRHLRRDWWIPGAGRFGDIRASRAELEALLARLDGMAGGDFSVELSRKRVRRALEQDTSAAPREQRRPWNFHYYLPALAAESGLPTEAQARELFARMETPEWTDTYGIVLDSALDRRVMTLPTGALAAGEARYGRMDAALDYIRRIASTLGAISPGTMAEYSPDGGCFTQMWSGYGVIWPVVHEFFGLRPDVARRRLTCVPNLPEAWPEARLSRVPVGDAVVDIHVERLAQGQRISLEISDPSWEIALGTVCPPGHAATAVLNGQSLPLRRAHVGIRNAKVAPQASGAAFYELMTSVVPRRSSPASGHGSDHK